MREKGKDAEQLGNRIWGEDEKRGGKKRRKKGSARRGGKGRAGRAAKKSLVGEAGDRKARDRSSFSQRKDRGGGSKGGRAVGRRGKKKKLGPRLKRTIKKDEVFPSISKTEAREGRWVPGAREGGSKKDTTNLLEEKVV